ncbi:CvfB family protein [Ferdinandcohnia quinoae]|uniref:S1-like domain-containing RNA-binding protein n=1 Tax=Fredinandcohnia quinoae TaxID=2918902 RepID=A0AAW5E882_9BACI|nr:S1-like domain-containing RNA-binding protein [Fredinandcohnia sp. SECRCQ15]MCH1625840.1 S1-like domain-containing RNA-binding protein [Fredinandcohnia sp. SECRCQ15]
MNELIPGTVVTLDVDREAPFGYFLTNGEEDVLLHNNEITEEFDLGDELTVFLFQDHQGRLAASMKIPTAQLNAYDWVEVVEVKRELGVFVNIGINKDILVSKDDLHEIWDLWPEQGDRLYCSLKTDKNGRLFGRLATEDVIRTISKNAERKDYNKNITGTVYRLLLVGSFIISDEGYIGFIHESQRKREPRLGEKVQGRIIDVKEDGSVNVSLLARGHEVIGDDAEQIYSYMESRGGAMPYWDKSDAEEIKIRFNMSKSAFKRALGNLMKVGKVYQEEGWTYFKKE